MLLDLRRRKSRSEEKHRDGEGNPLRRREEATGRFASAIRDPKNMNRNASNFFIIKFTCVFFFFLCLQVKQCKLKNRYLMLNLVLEKMVVE